MLALIVVLQVLFSGSDSLRPIWPTPTDIYIVSTDNGPNPLR
jgi:hypothetical protein